MASNNYFSLISVIITTCLLVSCGGSPSSGTPNPPATTVDVGGWRQATTTMKGYSMIIKTSGGLQSEGWQITVTDALRTSGYLSITLRITNNTASTGAIDLHQGPSLISATGETIPLFAVNAKMEDGAGRNVEVASAVSVSSSVNCHMTSPDAGGVQDADCWLIITVNDGKAQLSVGAEATVDVEFIFETDKDLSTLTLKWLDKTLFALP